MAGPLELVRKEAKALRLADVTVHPSARGMVMSRGLSPSLLGTPVVLGGRLAGAFCLLGKKDQAEFSQDDEGLIGLFALIAGVMLENSGLYNDVVQERSTLAAIQTSMSEGLIVLSTEGNIVYCNPTAQVFRGIQGEAVGGRLLEEVLRRKGTDFEDPGAMRP